MLEEDDWLAMGTAEIRVENPVDGENITIIGHYLVFLTVKPSICYHHCLGEIIIF